jgi:hypothetical protein
MTVYKTQTLPLVTSHVLPVFIYYKSMPEIRPKDVILSAYKKWEINIPSVPPHANFIKAVVTASGHQLFPILFVNGFVVYFHYLPCFHFNVVKGYLSSTELASPSCSTCNTVLEGYYSLWRRRHQHCVVSDY